MDQIKVTTVLSLEGEYQAVEDTVQSLLNQTCREIEILILPCDRPLPGLPRTAASIIFRTP